MSLNNRKRYMAWAVWMMIAVLVGSASVAVLAADETPPVIHDLPADISEDNDAGSCGAVVTWSAPTATDDVGVTSFTSTHSSGESFPIGTTTVIYTATDAAGNSTSDSFTVTIVDAESPIPVCQDITIYLDSGGSAAITGDDVDGGSSDNCAASLILSVSPSSFSCGDLGANTVTLTVSDGTNEATCTAIVTVLDNIDPTITAPADKEIGTDSDACYASAVVLGVATTGDNCSVGSVEDNAPDQFPLGPTTVTWTVTDTSGNTATDTQIVTVVDDIDPTITAPADVMVFTDTGQCYASGVSLGTPVTDDNCTVDTVDNDAPTQFEKGETTVTWTVTDAAGNTATDTQLVTVVDNEDPVISGCPSDITVDNDTGECGAVVTWTAPTVSDNCPGESMTSTHASGDYFNVGATVVTYTATDAAGNTATCSFTVTVIDAEDPVISGCPAGASADNVSGTCAAPVTWTVPSASDNCSVASSSSTHNPGDSFPVGTTTVTYTATDAAGNTATCSFDVVVSDTQDPTITAPSDVLGVPADPGVCYATGITLGLPTVDDNCGIGGVSNNAPTQFPVGPTIVTWTVTDSSGNTATADQNVTVIDTQSPTITAPADMVESTDADACHATGVDLGTPGTGDNCSVADVSNDAPDEFPKGSTTVTWTVTDSAGLTATDTQIVTVVDDVDPTITAPVDLSVSPDAGSCLAMSVVLGDPATWDNCGGEIATNDAPDQFPVGDTTVTWTVTDTSGNTATDTQIVTVTDDEDPTITAPDDVTLYTDPGQCYATNSGLGTPIYGDNCTVDTVESDAPGQFDKASSPFTVTWTVTDTAGNTATDTQMVTVEDNENPAISGCPADITVDNDPGLCSAVVPWTEPTVSDNCPGASMTSTHASGSLFDVGSTVVTYTATDAAGNEATCSFTVTVVDAEDPVIGACPADKSVSTDPGKCYATIGDLGTLTATDNCTGQLDLDITDDAPAVFGKGDTTVTWTVTDAAGNLATCTQIVTVTDNESPVFSGCPSDISVGNDAGDCGAIVSWTPPTVSDNCGVRSITSTHAPGDSFPVGTTTVTYTAVDTSNNEGTCAFDVTVTDDEAPSAACQDLTLSIGVDGTVELPASQVDAGSTDNCGIVSWLVAPNSFDCGDVGEDIEVTLTVGDAAGNSDSCTATVSIVDTQAPVIHGCPSDQTLDSDPGQCGAMATWTAPWTEDNCSLASFTSTHIPGDVFPIGTTTVTYTATDVGGHSDTCSFVITVVDAEDPWVVCPPNVTVGNDPGECFATNVPLGTPTTWDNCSGETVTHNAPAQYPMGDTTVTWTVTDASGRTATCDQIVTVEDDEAPVAVCQTLTVQLDASGTATIDPLAIDGGSTDNCGIVTRIANPSSVGCSDVGEVSVLLTVYDAAANSGSCTVTVTVEDSIEPVIHDGPADQTVPTDPGVCSAVVVWDAPWASDNCSIASFTSDHASGDTFPTGDTTVTYTAVDGAGNAAGHTFVVSVSENELPVIECPASISATTDAGECFATIVDLGAPVATDNCGVPEVSNDAPDTFPVGVTTVTWTATDASGNTATCTQTVTVTDAEVPVLSLLGADPLVIECGSAYAELGADATDNCCVDLGGLAIDASGVDTTTVGSYTVTYDIVDCAGNAAVQVTRTVNVVDTTPPVLSLLGADPQVIECGGSYAELGADATDNCCVDLGGLAIDASGVDTTTVGSYTVTYDIVDCAGNAAVQVTRTVNVVDTTPPTITCPGDIRVEIVQGRTSVSGIELGVPGVSDGCAIASVVNDAPASFPLGETVVTWTVTDPSGNTATCAQVVTVVAVASPVEIVPATELGTFLELLPPEEPQWINGVLLAGVCTLGDTIYGSIGVICEDPTELPSCPASVAVVRVIPTAEGGEEYQHVGFVRCFYSEEEGAYLLALPTVGIDGSVMYGLSTDAVFDLETGYYDLVFRVRLDSGTYLGPRQRIQVVPSEA